MGSWITKKDVDILTDKKEELSEIIQECGKLTITETEETFDDQKEDDNSLKDSNGEVPKYVCFTSKKNGNWQQNHLLGFYKKVGATNDIEHYRQIDSTKNEQIFAFQNSENKWSLGSTNGNPWTHDWILDPSILIWNNDEKKICGSLFLSAFDDDVAERWPDCIGMFYPTFEYRYGRLVFKHFNHQVYLFIMRTDDFCSWVLGADPDTDTVEDVCILLGSNSSSVCPESGSGSFIINCDVHGFQ